MNLYKITLFKIKYIFSNQAFTKKEAKQKEIVIVIVNIILVEHNWDTR